MQAWAEGPDVESRISLAPIAVQLTLAGPGAPLTSIAAILGAVARLR